MIGEDIKTKVTLEELRRVTWDYSEEEIIGLYLGEVVRGFMWEAKECEGINPPAVTKCNVAEGWVEYFEVENPKDKDILTILKEVKRNEDGEPIRTKVNCKVVVDLFDDEGNVIVTLR